MKGSFRIFKVFGISINIHITFFLLVFMYMAAGVKALVLIIGIFAAVTMHELCHSLVAKRFGITVREITLLPIGGLASMTKMPDKPSHEFLISAAGPLFNIFVIVALYFPVRYLVGYEAFYHPPSIATWNLTFAYMYWVNLVLAVFNLIPAFPMDGGRILRALLAGRLGYRRATRIAVNFGNIFALLFAYIGITRRNMILIAIAIFIYMAASSEELQIDVRETLKKIRIRDIVSRDFLTVNAQATLAAVLETILGGRQEDFPVTEGAKVIGFLTRGDIITGVHRFGTSLKVSEAMRRDFPSVAESDTLVRAQALMDENNIKALPVLRGGEAAGVVTIEDISRVYAMASSH